MKVTRESNWKLVVQSLIELGGRATTQELTDYFKRRFSESQPGNEKRKPVNVRKDLEMLAVNFRGRLNYSISKPKCRRSDSGHEKDKIFLAGEGVYELYIPAKHGVWETFERADGSLQMRRVLNQSDVQNHEENFSPQRTGSQSDSLTESMLLTHYPEEAAGDLMPESSTHPMVPNAALAASSGAPNGGDSFDQIYQVLDSLALKRPIFHSEADFQHALAWEIGLLHPATHIRLEIPSIFREKRASIDMLTRDESRVQFFELKYKTRGAQIQLNGENFVLKQQSAQDQGASDFLKDVCRIEAFVDATHGAEGFAIMLTNDSRYWADSFGANVIDREFKLVEGREIGGTLSWLPTAGLGSIGKRERSLHLRSKYRIHWKDYSDLRTKGVHPYRYLCLHITSSTAPH